MKKIILFLVLMIPVQSFAIKQNILSYCSVKLNIDGEPATDLWISVDRNSYLNKNGTEAEYPVVEVYGKDKSLLWSNQYDRAFIKYKRNGEIKSVTIKKENSRAVIFKATSSRVISRLPIFKTDKSGVEAYCIL